MSAFGSYEACLTVCQCHDCRLRNILCNPCICCEGIHESELTDDDIEWGSCGYMMRGEYCEIREKMGKKI
jgi:tRNA U34 2-thiouridine synthase MnmA/TrmU